MFFELLLVVFKSNSEVRLIVLQFMKNADENPKKDLLIFLKRSGFCDKIQSY